MRGGFGAGECSFDGTAVDKSPGSGAYTPQSLPGVASFHPRCCVASLPLMERCSQVFTCHRCGLSPSPLNPTQPGLQSWIGYQMILLKMLNELLFFWGGVWHCGREQCSSCLALNLEQHFCHFVSRDIDPSPQSWTEKRRKGMHDLKFGTVRLKMCLATPATQRVGSHLGNTATTSLSITANRQKDKSIFDFMWFFFLS